MISCTRKYASKRFDAWKCSCFKAAEWLYGKVQQDYLYRLLQQRTLSPKRSLSPSPTGTAKRTHFSGMAAPVSKDVTKGHMPYDFVSKSFSPCDILHRKMRKQEIPAQERELIRVAKTSAKMGRKIKRVLSNRVQSLWNATAVQYAWCARKIEHWSGHYSCQSL